MRKHKYVKLNVWDTGAALTIVLDGDGYLVRIGGEVEAYDNDTLPKNVRTKLGLLKLVQPNHVVPQVGHRVSENVFVIDLLGVIDERTSSTPTG